MDSAIRSIPGQAATFLQKVRFCTLPSVHPSLTNVLSTISTHKHDILQVDFSTSRVWGPHRSGPERNPMDSSLWFSPTLTRRRLECRRLGTDNAGMASRWSIGYTPEPFRECLGLYI